MASRASAMDADVKRWWEAYVAEFSMGPANAQQLIAYASNRGGALPYGVVRRYLDGLKGGVVGDMPDPSSEAMPRPVQSIAVVREDSEPGSNQTTEHSPPIISDDFEPDCDEDPGLPGPLQTPPELTSGRSPEPAPGRRQLLAQGESLRLLHYQGLPPAVQKAWKWLEEELPELLRSGQRGGRINMSIPVLVIRWTHKHINASLAFGDDHENAQENVLKLLEQLFRGRVRPDEMEPLVVKLPASSGVGIRSRSNRRLVALRMLQSLRMDECIMAPCDAASHQYYLRNPQFRAWFDKGDDGGSGWSINSREGTSKHRNVPIFNNAAAAETGLRNLVRRQKSKPEPDQEKVAKVEEVLENQEETGFCERA